MFSYNILICQSIPQLRLLGSQSHVYLMSCENCSLGALTKRVSVAATHSKAFSPFTTQCSIEKQKLRRSHTECKHAKWDSSGRNMSIFQVPSRPADLYTVLVQVYHIEEEENTEQKSFIHSGITARHSNNSAQLIYKSKIKTIKC